MSPEALKLATEILALADQPREVGPEHQAAQNSLAGMGVDLAQLVLEADDG